MEIKHLLLNYITRRLDRWMDSQFDRNPEVLKDIKELDLEWLNDDINRKWYDQENQFADRVDTLIADYCVPHGWASRLQSRQ
jgi:hypothetical protein